MKPGGSMAFTSCFWPKFHEQAMGYEQMNLMIADLAKQIVTCLTDDEQIK